MDRMTDHHRLAGRDGEPAATQSVRQPALIAPNATIDTFRLALEGDFQRGSDGEIDFDAVFA